MGKIIPLPDTLAKIFWRLAIILIAAPVFLIGTAEDAEANVVCSVNSPALDMGTSLTGAGSIPYTCINYNNAAANFTLCAGLGNPSYPGTIAQPKMQAGSSTLNFNVYRDAAATQIWTTSLPLTKSVTIPAGIGTSVQGTIPFYGRITGGQTSPPGDYAAYFYNTRLGFIIGSATNCQTNATGFSGLDFTLPIRARISNDCTVTALGSANLGPAVPSSSPVFGSTTISVLCPSGTAYKIGMRPSNGNSAGLGELTGTGTNTDKPSYQLRSVSSTGPIWGNTATTTSVGNGVAGTGNGSPQNFPVFVSVPNTNYTPDVYQDTVTVILNF